jgi:DnaJ-class molecular chaperone
MENTDTTNNLYETLGITKSATADEIKKVNPHKNIIFNR